MVRKFPVIRNLLNLRKANHSTKNSRTEFRDESQMERKFPRKSFRISIFGYSSRGCPLFRNLCKFPIDHFTVVCLVTWSLNGSEAGVDLVLIQTSLFYCANHVVLMLTSWHLHKKSKEFCIKTRSPPASLAFMAR